MSQRANSKNKMGVREKEETGARHTIAIVTLPTGMLASKSVFILRPDSKSAGSDEFLNSQVKLEVRETRQRPNRVIIRSRRRPLYGICLDSAELHVAAAYRNDLSGNPRDKVSFPKVNPPSHISLIELVTSIHSIMGVKDLLKDLKRFSASTNAYQYCRGKRVGIDAFVWLHQLSYACAEDLVVNNSSESLCGLFRRRLLHCLTAGWSLMFVFEGRPLPGKCEVNSSRSAQRQEASRSVEAAIKSGCKPDDQLLRKAVHITQDIVRDVIGTVLRPLGVRYIVRCDPHYHSILIASLTPSFTCSPYESDHQLALLDKEGLIDVVVTMDSDLLVHGCKQVLFNVNWVSGVGDLFTLDDIANRKQSGERFHANS